MNGGGQMLEVQPSVGWLQNGHSYNILHGTVWMWASLKAFVCVDIHSLVPLMAGAPP